MINKEQLYMKKTLNFNNKLNNKGNNKMKCT